MADTIEVVCDQERWYVRRQGVDDVLSVHDNQEDAAQAARNRALSERAVYELHDDNGNVVVRQDYTHEDAET
jgi:hypothetical protein